MIKDIIFDKNSFRAVYHVLKLLRDTMYRKVGHRTAVVEIPTNSYSCGYMIIDLDQQTAIFTGGGFRIDGQGVGGIAHRAAHEIFTVHNINPIPWNHAFLEEIYDMSEEDIRSVLLLLANEVEKGLNDSSYGKITLNLFGDTTPPPLQEGLKP